MSDTMTEGVVVEWHKKIGDPVSAGDLMAEIETDKATMELESYQSGTLIYIGAQPGDAVAVNGIIAILGEEGEDIEAILASEKSVDEASAETPKEESKKSSTPAPTPTPSPPPAPSPVAEIQEQAVVKTASANGRIKASPLARKLANENNIDLSTIQGSGDGGRIVKKDVEAYISNAPSVQAVKAGAPAKETPQIVLPEIVGTEQYEDIRNSQMRKTIARRLGESKFQAPHFYLTMEINMDSVIAARKKMNETSPVKISFNDIIIKAVALSLRQHPQVNASWMGDFIRYNKHIHIGMAVAVDEGLLVPVIRFVDNKSLSHIASETKVMAGKARDRKLSPDEMSGNTFTISNLGMMDIDEFTAIINPPEACIMAVGKIAKVPKVNDAGEIVVQSVMKITMSCDHRVVDGAVGARFLQTFKSLLEEPYRMLV